MAQDSWPSPAHNARAVTDTEYEKIAAAFSGDGVYGTPADPAVVTAGTGLSVNVRAAVYGSVRGHAWTSGTTTVNLPISPNLSGQTRTDRIVLRLDRATWTVRAIVKQGVPGSGPPMLTQQTGDVGVYEVLLATVTVPNGANSVTVARNERYVGTRIRPVDSKWYDPNPQRGEVRYEVDTDRLRVYTGAAWRTVFSDSGAIEADANVPSWSVVVAPILEERNGTVNLRLGQFSRTGGNLSGPADSRLPVLVPAAYRHPNRNVYSIGYITGAKISRITIYPANHSTRPGQAWLTQKPDITNADDVLPGDVSWVVD
ncbi:hypothetical protein ABT390_36530 [Streptomyces aurantiacus]|uniref:Minor tail protein n=1 Tax=Streptomyces aurantiacus JA 4570 TaxID=1286094 RepID=S3ZCI2_9ACTN|nr:hypothetical protein [Streptomyces aurantiacus]EPH40843.1 hypothetical protein STRAU_6058 [Streptomyces aurantiacus JA 4570]